MKFTDVMGCVSTAVILLLVSAWIPFIGPLFSLLTPLPFLYYTTKLGPYQGLKIVFLSFLIIGLIAKLIGSMHLIFLCVELGLLGLIISEIFRRGLTFGLTIFWGTTFMLSIGLIFLLLIGLSKKMGPIEFILDYFQTNLSEFINASKDMTLEQEKIIHLQEFSKLLSDFISKVYPSFAIIGTGLIVWGNVIISKPLFRIRNLKYPEFGPMDHWSAPEPMVWGFIAAGFTAFFATTTVRLLAVNAIIVMSVIYVFHGISIVLFFLNKYNVHPWVRFGIYLLIIFQQLFLVMLALAGLFDQWMDFRKIFKNKTV